MTTRALATSIEGSATGRSEAGLTRPVATVLWNGQPLEDLGIAESFISASFTTTCGRSKATKTFKAGRPKVGGAQIVFSLQDRDVARTLFRLLHVGSRPNISLGFGYEGGPAFWVGGFRIGEGVNRELKRIGAFKLDKVTTKYDSSSVNSLTLTGMTDKALSLVERMKPRVYMDTTIRRILEGVADEHGISLEIDPSLPVDQRVRGIMKTSRESDWDMVAQLAQQAGAAGVTLSASHEPGLGEVGATNLTRAVAYQTTADGRRVPVELPQLTSVVRNILRISRLPAFIELSGLEQTRPIVIGYGASLSSEMKARCDYLAVDVSIEESGYKSAPVPSSASTSSEDSATATYAGNDKLGNAKPGEFSLNVEYKGGIPWLDQAYGSSQRADRLRTRDANEGSSAALAGRAYHQVVSSLPPEVDGGVLMSAKQSAMALALGLGFEVQIRLNPGVPSIQAPTTILLLGTDAHDGLYGAEDVTTTLDAKAGLVTQLKCRPIDVREQGKAAAGLGDFADAGTATYGLYDKLGDVNPGAGALVLNYADQRPWLEHPEAKIHQNPRVARQKPEPVPAR